MLNYNEITQRKYIVLDGAPYEVQTSHVFRKQQRKPVNQTKLKNLITGKIMERSFHQAETVEEAHIEVRPITYLYNNRGQYWFCDKDNPKNRFSLEESFLGDQKSFLKENAPVDSLVFEEQIIGIKLPIKLDLEVVEAPPGIKGNTAQGGTKQVVLETGAVVNTPLFINVGDIIRINTETGEYTERVDKK